MKRILILSIIICIATASSFAQISLRRNKKAESIEKLDSNIYYINQFDIKTLPEDTTGENFFKLFKNMNIHKADFYFLKKQEQLFKEDIKKLLSEKSDINISELYEILELENPAIDPDTLTFFIERIHTYKAIFGLYQKLDERITKLEKDNPYTIYLGGLKRNLAILENHMNHLLKYYYCQYSYINTSNMIIKGVSFYMDNDLFGITNHDMNYTGGGRIEITTDLLKMRTFPFINNDKILAYQGVFFGTEAYTPYIRNASIFNADTSFDVSDRPFASYEYIGRSKYRILYNGNARMRSDFKLGVIGGNVGNVFQSVIHRDQYVSSLKPYGWDSQIASGGRFAWNIDHYFDAMLFSGQGDIFKKERKTHNWVNVPLHVELHFGNELTAVGAGIGFSTLSFKQQSGTGDLKIPAGKSWNWVASANISYRYVIHNSMLEGLGMIDTFEDDDDPFAPKDMYRLDENEVERNLIMGDVSLGVRFMKTTIFYKCTFNTQEYDKPKAKDYYTWGRIGLSYIF